MKEGNVKFYNSSRGFGFVKGTDGPDIFINAETVAKAGIRTITEGQKINYEIEINDGQETAVNIKLIA